MVLIIRWDYRPANKAAAVAALWASRDGSSHFQLHDDDGTIFEGITSRDGSSHFQPAGRRLISCERGPPYLRFNRNLTIGGRQAVLLTHPSPPAAAWPLPSEPVECLQNPRVHERRR